MQRAYGNFQQEGADEQIGNEDHLGGDGEQRTVIRTGQPNQHQRDLDANIGQPQRSRRRIVAILPGKQARKRFVGGGQPGNFCSHDGPAQIGAADGNDQSGGDRHLAPGPHHSDHQPGHRRITHFRELRTRDNAQREQRDQKINRQRRKYGQQRRAANVLLVPRSRRHYHRALYADKHPQGNQHGIFHLLPHRHAERQAAEIESEGL